jgi:hypothetical protein
MQGGRCESQRLLLAKNGYVNPYKIHLQRIAKNVAFLTLSIDLISVDPPLSETPCRIVNEPPPLNILHGRICSHSARLD